jgi:NAD(P)-dependent dehydrogenase (short-subunit alcohol dehydrogenase family)
VLATCRDPAHAQALQQFAASHSLVTIEALDVTNTSAIDALSAQYRGKPIDALINNAGIGTASSPRASELDPEEFQRARLVNTYAPLRAAGAFLEQVAASRQRKIIAITSGLGSLWQAPQATLRGSSSGTCSPAILTAPLAPPLSRAVSALLVACGANQCPPRARSGAGVEGV